MNNINEVRDFYNAQIWQANFSDDVSGSNYLPLYLRSPYLFAEGYVQDKVKLDRGEVKILDLCCGTGVHTVKFAQLGYTVEGIDISSISVDRAKKLAEKFNVMDKTSFTTQEVGQKLNFPDENFNVVFISGSLYYLDYEKIVPEIIRILKKGGVFICIETNGDNFIMNFVRKIKHIFLKYRDQRTIDNLLRIQDIDRILQLFPYSEVRYFDLFTLVSGFFDWNDWLLRKWLVLATSLDNFFLNKFGLRKFAFKFVVIGKK